MIIENNASSRLLMSVLTKGVLCLGMTGLISLGSCSKSSKNDRDAVSEVEVAFPIVKDSVVVYNSYPATIQSDSKADVVARANGQLVKKHFENGAYVRKGDVLFTLESTIYDAQVRDAAAGVSSAQGQLDYAEKHLAALENAYTASAVSEMDVLQARSAKKQAEANLHQAMASLTTARTKRDYCIVRAPLSGKISAATLDVGAYVAGEGAPVTLATIYDESSISAHFSVPDSEYAMISSGNGGLSNPIYRNIPVVIGNAQEDSSDGGPVFSGNIIYEAPSVDLSTGNIQMKARIDSPGDHLRDGMYANVSLPVGVTRNAILVKDASISTDQRGKYVYLVNDSNKVVYTPVEIGELYQDSLRLIKSGLSAGDRYVTKAILTVRTGETVKPVVSNPKVGK
ncbi:MAG: efflux RND transporter periplasmic adaptor subunit [Bacteroides sp.]|nr:efflux RND transporter periplasmic adaptor subunit [Bacteroides sp.]